MKDNFIDWLESLPLQTLTDELKSEIIDKLDENEIFSSPDRVVEQVVDKFNERSAVGIKKYGTTLDENKTDNFLIHLQEELMDATLYVQKLLNQTEIEIFSKADMEKAFIAGGKMARNFSNPGFDEFLNTLEK